jgi:hypothetical protein
MSDTTQKPNLRILSVDDILKANDLAEEVVEVPEWGDGVAVRVRAFTRKRLHELRREATVVTPGGKSEIDETRLDVLMFIYGVVEPQFGPEHYDLLAEKSSGALQRVLKRVIALSGLGDEAVKSG